MGRYEGIHLYHSGSPVLLLEKSFHWLLSSEVFLRRQAAASFPTRASHGWRLHQPGVAVLLARPLPGHGGPCSHSPKPSHISAHVWDGGACQRLWPVCTQTAPHLRPRASWRLSFGAAVSWGCGVSALCCNDSLCSAACGTWEHMALCLVCLFVLVFLFLSILVYCHK